MAHNPFAPVLTNQPPNTGQRGCTSSWSTTSALLRRTSNPYTTATKLYRKTAGCDDETLKRLGFAEVIRLAELVREGGLGNPGSGYQCVCGQSYATSGQRSAHILELSDDDLFGHKMLWAMMRSQ